jgi:hypothetical protein
MGKIKSTIAFTGSVGNTITYQVGNQLRIRSKPQSINMPQTEGVKKAKSTFGFASKLAKLFYNTTKKLGNERNPDVVETVYNALCRLIYRTGLTVLDDGKISINWEQLQICEGSLVLPPIKLERNETELICTWNRFDLPSELHDAELILLQIDEETHQMMVREAYVKHDELRIPLGIVRENPGRTSLLYLSMIHIQQSKTLKSPSLFLGRVTQA